MVHFSILLIILILYVFITYWHVGVEWTLPKMEVNVSQTIFVELELEYEWQHGYVRLGSI